MNHDEPAGTIIDHLQPRLNILNHDSTSSTMIRHREPSLSIMNYGERSWTADCCFLAINDRWEYPWNPAGRTTQGLQTEPAATNWCAGHRAVGAAAATDPVMDWCWLILAVSLTLLYHAKSTDIWCLYLLVIFACHLLGSPRVCLLAISSHPYQFLD